MSNKIQIKNVRLSYANVFTARAMQEGQEPKYSTQIIMDKNHPQLEEVKKAIFAVAKEKFPKLVIGSKFPARLKSPLRDGDEEYDDDENYSNKIFFNASNKRRPTVVDRDRSAIADDDNIIYSGCYANAIVEFYGFDTAGNKGVAVSLGGIQFVRDGEALGGKGVTAEEFDEVDSDEDEDYSII